MISLFQISESCLPFRIWLKFYLFHEAFFLETPEGMNLFPHLLKSHHNHAEHNLCTGVWQKTTSLAVGGQTNPNWMYLPEGDMCDLGQAICLI